MPNEFVIRNGAQISSSLSVTGSTSISGSSDVLNALATAGGSAPVFNVFGTAGQLFTVIDGLSGSLFSVNNISGLPFLEGFSDSRLVAGGYNKNTFIVSGSQVAIGKTIGSAIFDISGSTQITGSLAIGGTTALPLDITSTSTTAPFLRVTGSTGNISVGTTASVAKLNVAGTTNVVSLYGSTTEGVVFDVNGPSGQLFSVVDGLSGSLFSVNTISGLPLMEVFSNGTINMGSYSNPAFKIVENQVTVTGTTTITGSQVITGSLRGQVVTVPTASGTASMDCSQGNFFSLTLSGSYTLFLSASNIQPGQTVNLRVTQPATSGSLSYGSTFKFAGGIPYTASSTGSTADIISFISFDTTTLYGSAIKNLF